MKKYLLVFLLTLSIVLFSGCVGGDNKTSEKNSTMYNASENNIKTKEDIQILNSKNTTVDFESENSTSNSVEENKSISKTPLIEVPLATGFSRYTDKIFGFSIDYPETWEQTDTGSGLGGKAFNPSGDDSYKTVILINIFSNESEAKWWISDKDMFEAMEKTGRILKFENVSINGRDGTELISKSIYMPEEADSASLYAVFKVEDKYYVYNAFTSENYKSKYEKVFETSLKSFVIDENLKAS